MLFDTHTHINVKQFEDDFDQVIQRAFDSGVEQMSVVGFDFESIEKALELSDRYEGIHLTIGWHPTEAGSYNDEVEAYLRSLYSSRDDIVAVGETGLDYHWMEDPKEVQAEAFRRQIKLAKEFNLPLSIHNRESTKDVYKILSEEGLPQAGCIMHSFGISTRWLKRFVDLGCMISLSGVVTFKNAPEVRDIAKAVPLDRLLIETDAPYLAPEPKRGKRNEPSYVRYVADQIAQVRGMASEDIADITTNNAIKFFRLG